MRRRLLFGLLVPVVAVLALSAPLLAATPAVSSASVPMQGQGVVVGTRYQPQLRLKLSSADGSRWLLEIALNPTQTRGSGGSVATVGLNGTYVLGPPGAPLSSGTAIGTLDQTGQGDIKLTDSKTSTSLDVPFSADSTGSIKANVNGQWPQIPSAQPATPPPAKTQPANHFFWYLARASGLVSYLLLFVSMCLGAVFKSGRASWGGGKWRTLDLHQFTGVLGLGLMFLHAFSLLGDKYFNYTLVQLLVPMTSPYRPFPIALGIIAFYISLVAIVAWLMRKSVGNRGWKVMHAAAVAVFLLGLIHGIASGSDTSSIWVQLLYAVSGGAAVFIGLSQLLKRRRPAEPDTLVAAQP